MLFSSHLHNTLVPQEAFTEDWPSALILNQKGWNDRAHMGAHGRNGSLYWLYKQRIKLQWSLRLTKLPKWHSVFPLAPTFSKLQNHWIPDLWLCDHRTQLQTKNYPSENFSLVGYMKDPFRKGGHWFCLRASHLLFSLKWISLFFAWCLACSLFSALALQ